MNTNETTTVDTAVDTNAITVFNHELFGNTRFIKDGDSFFVVAKDVVERVGNVWKGTSNLKHIPEQWRRIRPCLTPRGIQELIVLSEQGLCFYLNRCDKPAARAYQMWIADEVAPALCEDGEYLRISTPTERDKAPHSNISIFSNKNFGQLRAILRDGETWFVAHDIARILGYHSSTDITKYLDTDEVSTCPDKSSGQLRTLSMISEAGFYSLILRSRKPEAKEFKRWVTHEVLPAIRKDGGYLSVTKEDDDFTILTKACAILKTANEKLETRIAEIEPKAALTDSYLSEGEEVSMADLAKKLYHEGISIGQNRLFKFLRDKGVLISRPGINFNTPTQKYADRRWFKIIQPPAGQMGKWKKQIRITPKGVLEISTRMHELFGNDL